MSRWAVSPRHADEEPILSEGRRRHHDYGALRKKGADGGPSPTMNGIGVVRETHHAVIVGRR